MRALTPNPRASPCELSSPSRTTRRSHTASATRAAACSSTASGAGATPCAPAAEDTSDRPTISSAPSAASIAGKRRREGVWRRMSSTLPGPAEAGMGHFTQAVV